MDRDGSGLMKYAYSGNFNSMQRPNAPSGELVGRHQFRPRGRLQQRPGLPCAAPNGRGGRFDRPPRRCRPLPRGRRKICAAYFKTFFNPGHRRPGRLAERRRTASRLLLPLYQRHRHPLRAGSQGPGRADHGPAAGQDEGGRVQPLRLGPAGQPGGDPVEGLRAPKGAVRRRRRRKTARKDSSTTRTAGQPPASPISRWPPCTTWAGASRPTKSCCPCSARSTATTSRAAISSTARRIGSPGTARPFGYEGYLADNYYALLSVLAREGMLREVLFRPTTAK